MSLLDVAMSRARGVSLDKVAATGAALATIAAVLLMPVAILQEAVLASGMAESFAPLQPPLGLRARFGLSLLAAGSAFGMVLLLMRLVGRAPVRRPEPIKEPEGSPIPKVRRRDRHPDAPARPPLSMSRDLGIDVAADEEEEPEQAPARTLLRSRRGRSERAPTIRREVEDPVRTATPWLRKADQDEEAEPLPRLTRIERAAGWAPAEEPAQTAPEPVAEAPQVEQRVEPEPQVFEPEVAEIAEFEAEPEPAPEPEAEADPEPELAAEEPVRAAAATPAWLEEARPVAQAEPSAPREESISELMARFERAMERRMAAARPADGPSARDEDESERLRSALESLKRFAPRQG